MDANLVLSILDDGQGFDVETKNKGIGLQNIVERVSEIDGEIDIISNENGTRLKITSPNNLS